MSVGLLSEPALDFPSDSAIVGSIWIATEYRRDHTVIVLGAAIVKSFNVGDYLSQSERARARGVSGSRTARTARCKVATHAAGPQRDAARVMTRYEANPNKGHARPLDVNANACMHTDAPNRNCAGAMARVKA